MSERESRWYLCCCLSCDSTKSNESPGLSIHQIDPSPPTTKLTVTMDDSETENGLDDEPARYPAFVRESSRSLDLYDPITLEELQKEIPIIDSELDKNIKTWEDSFRKYEELESKSLEVIGPELIKVLGSLRDDPDAFLNSSNPAIRSLARTRTSLYASTSSPRESSSLEIGRDSGSRRKSLNLQQPNNTTHRSHPQPRRGSLPEMRPMSMSSLVSHSFGERPSDLSSPILSHEVVSNSREGAHLAFGQRRIQSVAVTRSSPHEGHRPTLPPSTPSQMGTRELSLIWAGRLAEMSPTQGQLSKQMGTNGQVLSLKMTPKWPGWLSDCLYDVIKINKFGKRQRRVIKLTEFHVLNIKGGKSVTKVIPYDGVRGVNLTSSKSFIIDFEVKTGINELETGTLFYESLLSAHIVQQVATRTQVRRDLDKIGKLTSTQEENRVGFSVGVTEAMIHAISDLVKKDNSDITQFAQLLGKRAIEQIQSTSPNLLASDMSSTAVESPLMLKLPEPDQTDAMKRLLSIQQGSGEYKLKSLIQKMILDVHSPEGNTLRHFLKNFPDTPKDENMTELRHFIDGLYEYLLENHLLHFAQQLSTETIDSPSIVRSPSENNRTPPQTTSLLRNSWNSFSSPSSPSLLPNIPLRLTTDLVISIAYLAFTVVEETLFLALQQKLISYCLSHEVREHAELLLLKKMKVLGARSQFEFEIPVEHTSPSDWSTAIFELAGVERNPTPSMRIHALVRTARAIYTEYKTQIVPIRQHEKRISEQQQQQRLTNISLTTNSATSIDEPLPSSFSSSCDDYVLGADDFLPIFIFVFCRSEIYRPIQNKDMLWKLCHPDQLQGESGYYLTIYESAVEYVLSIDIDQAVLDQTQVVIPETNRNGIMGPEKEEEMSTFSRIFSSKKNQKRHRRFSTFT